MKMEKTKINLENFFTEDNEKTGVWFEPRIKGEPCGIEFLVTGLGSDENQAGNERYEKAMDATNKLKDPIEKAAKRKVIDANRIAEFVHGIRAADGNEIYFEGKPLEFSVPVIQQLLLKSPLIKIEIAKFAMETANFIKREKND
jgi:hypothetical protein